MVLGTTNDAEWQRLTGTMLGRDDLAADPRYASNEDRVRHRGELDAVLARWCSGRTLAEVEAAAEAAGIGNAVYRTPSEVIEHPHLGARNRWREVDSPAGPVCLPLPPLAFGEPDQVMRPVPELGEHTKAVLAELGIDPPTVAS